MHHCETGTLADYSPREIESLVNWWGKPGAMLKAMLRVGFLIQTENGYSIPQWGEYQGHIATYKSKAKAMALARWGHRIRDATSNAASIAASNAIAEQGRAEGSERARGAPLPAPVGFNGTAAIILAEKELARVEAARSDLRNSYSEHQTWSATDKAKFQELSQRRKELKARLGFIT